jgi:phosphotransferase system enzyme I (PtsI)
MSPASENQRAITGVGLSPGRASGVVITMAEPVPEPPSGGRLDDDASAEDAAALIATAAAQACDDLTAAAARATGAGAEILATTAMMAADPTLVSAAQRLVRQDRIDPARALWQAATTVIDQLASLGGYLAARTGDVADVRSRIVAVLTGRPAPGVPSPGHPSVLCATDLSPADTATLDPGQVVAIITSEGGPTSHTAIIARSLGIPAVVGANDANTLAGTLVLVDGAAGSVSLEPTDEQIARAATLSARARVFDGTGHTRDGHRVPLLANIGKPEGARAAADCGAEGVGLFRTEFCFLDRAQEPSIDEQVAQYRQVLVAFACKKVVVRTLDAGADKPLPFLSSTDEPNPALGVRGCARAGATPACSTTS